MKLFRKVIFWCHLAAGVAAGLVILIMSVTGVLLAYERQITYWADTRGYQVQPPSPDAQRQGVEKLLEGVRAVRPGAATVTVRADPTAPAEVGFGREGTIFVNPYTGEVLGGGSTRVRAFFRSVTDWHRWLGASGEGTGRGVGRAITGASNFVFLFIVVSGIYLWWPRKWKKRLVRNVTWFKRGLTSRARNFNWHNTIGFWSAIPLFIVVLSGVVISYSWAGNLVYRVFGETPPAPRSAPGQPPANAGQQQRGAAERRDAGRPEELTAGSLDRLWALAEQQQQGWRSISLRLPAATEPTAVFTIDLGNGGQPQKRSQLTLDLKTGQVVRWEPFSSQTPGRRARSWLRFAHTGEAAGVVGQTVAGIASAGGAVLVWTGLALAWRRFRLWRAKGTRKPVSDGEAAGQDEDYRGDGL
ncbi:MAG TPA: PepSY-associated TM helix domain-containing protein [Pyrinomonadaceae bacterium]|nr:PepSY-associated TM helix domain-containing protein [Pyrinomonadaceae bacterium]